MAEISTAYRVISIAVLSLLCTVHLSSPSPARVTYLASQPQPIPGSPALPDTPSDATDIGPRAAASPQRQRSADTEDEGDDYEDVDVYGFAHFWHNMADYAHSLVEETNASLASEISDINTKIEELEKDLSERDEEVASLREEVESLSAEEEDKRPSVGDVRLVLQEEGEQGGTRGRLLIYTGEELQWGFVCDDMFYTSEANVVCRQLGYSRGVVDISRDLSARQLESLDRDYTIVLDDVRCGPADTNLMACQHEPTGVHNCVANEAVNVMCYR